MPFSTDSEPTLVATTPPQFATGYLAAEALKAGDVAILSGSDGLIRYALPGDQLSVGGKLRPVYSPSLSVGGEMAPPAQILLANDRACVGSHYSAQLKSGSILHAWLASDAAVIAIAYLDNTMLLAPQRVAGGVALCARVWATGNFVMATVVGGVTQIRTYTDAGAEIGSQSLPGIPLDIAILANGNVAICVLLPGGAMAIAIYTPALAVVLASNQIVAAAAGVATLPGNSSFTQILPLTGGGFGLAATTCNGVASDSIPRYMTFNDAGIQQGATVLGQTQTGSTTGRFAATPLTGGGWAVFEACSGVGLQLRGFAANGTQTRATITVVASANGQTLGNAAQLSNGTIIVAWTTGNTPTTLGAACYLPDLSSGYTTALGTGTLGAQPSILSLGRAAHFIFWPGAGASIRWMTEFGGVFPLNGDTAVVSPVIALKLINLVFPQEPVGHKTFAAATAGGSTFAAGTYFQARPMQIPLGIVAGDVAPGNPVTIQTTGVAATRLQWSAPFVIDAGCVGGNKMAIVAKMANLIGIVPKNAVSGVIGALSGVGSLAKYTALFNAEVTLNCSAGAGGGTVYNKGNPIYNAVAGFAPANVAVKFLLAVGQTMEIRSDGSANVQVSVEEQ